MNTVKFGNLNIITSLNPEFVAFQEAELAKGRGIYIILATIKVSEHFATKCGERYTNKQKFKARIKQLKNLGLAVETR